LHRRELDGVVDGIVYAGMVAAGFAFVENILYLGRAFEVDSADGYLTFVMRGLLSPFAHPLFTAFTGIAVGLAVRRRGVLARLGLPLLGYAFAVILHALWNASALWDGGRGFLPTYLSVMVPLFVAMSALAVWQRRREQRVVSSYVPRFAQQGWIAWSEVPLLSTMRGRRQWRRAAGALSGREAKQAVRDYQVAVTELAFLADRISRGAVSGPQAAHWHAEVLANVAAARARAVEAAA
ncbi:MAG TPA: PrsW family intramembrane metalloprotease, partial [Jiangellaceae bacterium]